MSEQNDLDKWPGFLTKDRNGKYVTASKRCRIIFLVCRLNQECGHDMFLLNATTKILKGSLDEGPENESSTGSAGSKRKRTSSDAFNATMDKRWSGLEKFMDDTRKVGEAIQQSVSTKQTGFSQDFEDLAERNKVLDMISSAYNAYHDANQRGADPKVVAFLQENYEGAMRKYSELRERSQGAQLGH